MKKRAATGGVQMFSFLDAMICTLGALLVLLHAFARHGQIEAVRKAEAKASQEVSQETQPEKEILEWRIEQLKQVRATTEAQLADQRLRLSHVEDHERRLQEKLRELKIAVDELAKLSERGEQRELRDQAKLEAARVRLTEARAAVEEARQHGQQAANYSVVPYEGLNSTHRRPVYVECRQDCMILQPEGVRLEPGDFAGYLGPGNPLASAMRGAREFYVRTAPTTGQDPDAEPYPLLLVRPDGVATYYAARSALDSWGSDFGYEMIGADWKLKFDEPDPRLAELFNRIVADSRMRMRELMVASAHLNSMRPRTTLRASSSGGFVEERGGSGGGSGRSHSGGRGGGWDSLDSDWARGSNPGGGFADHPGGTGNGSGRGNGGTTPGGAMPGADAPGGTLAQGAGAGNGGTTLQYPAGTKGSMPGEPRESFGGGSGMGSEGKGQTASRYGAARGGNGTGSQSGSGEQAQSNGATGSQTGPKGGYAANAGDADNSGGTPMVGGNSGGASRGAQNGTAASGGAGGSASSSSAASSMAAMSHGGSPSSHASKSNSLAKMRGRDWGLPDAGEGMSPVTRMILVRCDNDNLIIVPEDRRGQPQVTRLGATAQENIDEFVSDVWQTMKGWGIAGRGFYWRPTLIVEVAPGAEQRFAEIKGLLDDSGLEVRERAPRAAPRARVFRPPHVNHESFAMAMDNENSSVGTDSFLDVITNFVGILIILVMVVGERASRMPLPEVKPPAAEDLAEKHKEATAIEANVQEIAENMQHVEGELRARTSERDQVSTLVAAIEHELGERRAALGEAERSQYDAQRELALAEDELERLEQERADAEATSAPPTITVESYPTPLGKTVSGKEAHFQLSGGKLTFVPFDALLDRLKATVSDYARQMNSAPEIRDTIGPVGGFRMRYVVERHDTPQGSFLQLAYVELLPVSGQLGEPVDQALAPNSRFREKLEMMSPREYTITVWTYPDSFAEFRRLKKELYDKGFQVAGRPLPEGMPIGASPHGSRSSAQ